MRCPHCHTHVHEKFSNFSGLWHSEKRLAWILRTMTCPNEQCQELILKIERHAFKQRRYGERELVKLLETIPVYPSRSFHPIPSEVPPEVGADLQEAYAVLPYSPQASAALSRRILQHILKEYAGTTKRELADQIQEVIDGGKLPSLLAEQIDAIRNTGNFAAHPLKSKHTGEILPVEVGEAEWNLETLDSLLDFYFVHPARVEARKKALNAKLSEGGKPEMKAPKFKKNIRGGS